MYYIVLFYWLYWLLSYLYIVNRQDEENEMRQAFRVFDIDGDGVIDASELKQTMRNLGEDLSDADVRAMIAAADKNGDGKIDYEGKQSDCYRQSGFACWATSSNVCLISITFIQLQCLLGYKASTLSLGLQQSAAMCKK